MSADGDITKSPKGEVELHRSFSAINEESGTAWGGGEEGLTIKVGLLGVDLENLREGCQRLACESEEIVQAIFERLGILHCRTSRIETALGLPPWQPPEDSDEAEMRTAQTDDENVDDAKGASLPRCLRGHALVPDEEGAEGPPKQCAFCKNRRPTQFRCSEGCYFHACQDCVLGAPEGAGAEADEAEGGVASAAKEDRSDAATVTKAPEEGTSRSPSNTSDESRCEKADDACCRPPQSRPQTPSTMMQEDSTDARLEVDSFGSETPDADLQEEAAKPPRPPRESTSGLKARLSALEAEVRELSIASESGVAKEAAAMAQEAAEACCTALHEDVSRLFAAFEEEVKASILQLQGQEPGEVRGIGTSAHEEVKKELAEFAEAMQQNFVSTSESLRQMLVEAQEEAEERLLGKANGMHQTVEGLHLRLEALEADLPRGRVRASNKGPGPRTVPAEGNAIEGLALGFSALVRSLGLSKGERVGLDWSWEEAGLRIEEAWAAKAREAWHLGLPPKPDLFDFLQSQVRAATSTTAPAPRLPDRREAARLTSRLASSPVSSGCGTLSFSPQSSAATEAKDLESETSPLQRPESTEITAIATGYARYALRGAVPPVESVLVQGQRPSLASPALRAAEPHEALIWSRAREPFSHEDAAERAASRLGQKEVKARKQYGIKYPALYAPDGHPHAESFNSVQRAHQNTLENWAPVQILMAFNGILYPKFAASCGMIWAFGRIVYGYGYAKGGPDGRMVGGLLSHLGDLPLLIGGFVTAFGMITA
ncbi:MGST3 [Symbiodinium microadriaticum]|nr:MGST3 [Symbiodinium microadriaticum]